MTTQQYGWGPPPPTTRSGGVRIPRPVIVLLGLLCVGLLTGLTRSPRGLGVIAAAALLVATWDAGRGRFLRVAALLALLVLAAPAPLPEQPAQRPPARAKLQAPKAPQADRLQGAREFTADVWGWAASGFTTPAPWAPDPKAKGGR
jgi:hypothetical protein